MYLYLKFNFIGERIFVMNGGITDPWVQIYGPVVSIIPGPIVVWDVRIVG